MSFRRIFMDWNRPALECAVDHLTHSFLDRASGRLDFDDALIIVPGSRAGRRLSQLLAARAKEKGLIFFPPEIQTVGNLPEAMYESKRPFASELVQQLAWVEAFKGVRNRAKKYFPNLPDSSQTVDWLDLGAMLARVHRELAAESLDFYDVLEKGKRLRGFSETKRWKFLRSLQESYLDVLDSLSLWDMQTARLFAIRNNECRTTKKIVLLSTVDLNLATRKMLDQVSSQVSVLIHAPENEALGFDEYGCLDSFYWRDKPIPVEQEQVLIVDQPDDQADAVCYLANQLTESHSAAEIVIGIPSREIAPYIQRRFREFGVNTHAAAGESIRQSSPCKLIETLTKLIETERYPEMAELLRHPDVESWLSRRESDSERFHADEVIVECDRYYNEHLVTSFEGKWLGQNREAPNLRQAIRMINEWLAPLRKKPQAMSHWCESLLDVLSQIYDGIELRRFHDDDAMKISALSQIRTAVEAFRDIPQALDIKISATNVLRLLLQKVGQGSCTLAHVPGAVELLGWLDLALDLAPAVIATNFNEGSVPESLNADMFLPNSLRKAMGLMDNERRYARDAYALSSMVHSKESLQLIIGKRNLNGDPIAPSRLFFATDRESIAQRVVRIAAPVGFLPHQSPESGAAKKQSEFFVPIPNTNGLAIDSISVTAFRTYLKCPYRFYLQHVLKLKSIHDQEREFNGMVFGNVLHEVFRQFGEDRIRLSESTQEIGEFLESTLVEHVQHLYGRNRLPAVEIQLQQMRYRLQKFAQWQSERTKEGWEIQFVEKQPARSRGVPFSIDDSPEFYLRGKIDRVDYHPNFKIWQILDYKTGDGGDSPDRTHRERGNWVDLQLPLYRHLAKEFGVDGTVQLGYILLPKDLKQIGESMARWTEEDLAEADLVAADCISRISENQFWPPVHPVPQFVGREYASICQDEVFEPRLATELEPAEAAAVAMAGSLETGSDFETSDGFNAGEDSAFEPEVYPEGGDQ